MILINTSKSIVVHNDTDAFVLKGEKDLHLTIIPENYCRKNNSHVLNYVPLKNTHSLYKYTNKKVNSTSKKVNSTVGGVGDLQNAGGPIVNDLENRIRELSSNSVKSSFSSYSLQIFS